MLMEQDRGPLSAEVFLVVSIHAFQAQLEKKYRTGQSRAEARMDVLTLIGLRSLFGQVQRQSPYTYQEDIAISQGNSVNFRMILAEANNNNWAPMKGYLLEQAAEDAQSTVDEDGAEAHDRRQNSRLLFKLGNSV